MATAEKPTTDVRQISGSSSSSPSSGNCAKQGKSVSADFIWSSFYNSWASNAKEAPQPAEAKNKFINEAMFNKMVDSHTATTAITIATDKILQNSVNKSSPNGSVAERVTNFSQRILKKLSFHGKEPVPEQPQENLQENKVVDAGKLFLTGNQAEKASVLESKTSASPQPSSSNRPETNPQVSTNFSATQLKKAINPSSNPCVLRSNVVDYSAPPNSEDEPPIPCTDEPPSYFPNIKQLSNLSENTPQGALSCKADMPRLTEFYPLSNNFPVPAESLSAKRTADLGNNMPGHLLDVETPMASERINECSSVLPDESKGTQVDTEQVSPGASLFTRLHEEFERGVRDNQTFESLMGLKPNFEEGYVCDGFLSDLFLKNVQKDHSAPSNEPERSHLENSLEKEIQQIEGRQMDKKSIPFMQMSLEDILKDFTQVNVSEPLKVSRAKAIFTGKVLGFQAPGLQGTPKMQGPSRMQGSLVPEQSHSGFAGPKPGNGAELTLIVNVHPSTTRQDLIDAFEKFGKMVVPTVVCKKETRHPKREWTATAGYAFVLFDSQDAAKAALEATENGLIIIKGMRVKATWAKKDSFRSKPKNQASYGTNGSQLWNTLLEQIDKSVSTKDRRKSTPGTVEDIKFASRTQGGSRRNSEPAKKFKNGKRNGFVNYVPAENLEPNWKGISNNKPNLASRNPVDAGNGVWELLNRCPQNEPQKFALRKKNKPHLQQQSADSPSHLQNYGLVDTQISFPTEYELTPKFSSHRNARYNSGSSKRPNEDFPYNKKLNPFTLSEECQDVTTFDNVFTGNPILRYAVALKALNQIGLGSKNEFINTLPPVSPSFLKMGSQSQANNDTGAAFYW